MNGSIIFIDELTRKIWAYLIKTKDRVFSIFSNWIVVVENKSGQKFEMLSDR